MTTGGDGAGLASRIATLPASKLQPYPEAPRLDSWSRASSARCGRSDVSRLPTASAKRLSVEMTRKHANAPAQSGVARTEKSASIDSEQFRLNISAAYVSQIVLTTLATANAQASAALRPQPLLRMRQGALTRAGSGRSASATSRLQRDARLRLLRSSKAHTEQPQPRSRAGWSGSGYAGRAWVTGPCV